MAARKTNTSAQSLKKTGKRAKTENQAVSYRDAGVDLNVYAESMKRLPALMQRTFSPRVVANTGGFAGLFSLDSGNGWTKRNYKDPLLVSGTDGVGTKLQVAQMLDRHDTVGIDLVAMCVNDVICCGAEPLFFLDYVAMSHDDPARLEQIVAGVSEGCRQSGSALLGGETAIMPGTYRKGDYDLAGFQVGVVDRKQLVNGSTIVAGDIVIGLASTGIHSNGFSLVRKIVFDVAGLTAKQHVDELGETIGETLLTPTRIYVGATQSLLSDKSLRSAIHGIAHITGGGIQENIERIMPGNVDLKLDGTQWKIPPVFPWLMSLGNVDAAEMYRVFNMGIGLTLIVSPAKATRISRALDDAGYQHSVIGEAVPGKGKVKINKRRTQ